MEADQARNQLPSGDQRRPARLWPLRIALILAAALVAVLGWLGLNWTRSQPPPPDNPTLWALATALQYTHTASATVLPVSPSSTSTVVPTRSADYGTFVYASHRDGSDRLWAHVPGEPQAVPLTSEGGRDLDPAFSPDGRQLAFRSHRDGQWDLYLLDLQSGAIVRLTDTAGYEGHPTWSPDGRWLAYEAFYGDDLDIWILPLDGGQAPIQLTNQPGADFDPDWDPNGRQIAFVSDRDGNLEIHLANLDDPDDRFANLTASPATAELHPAFDPAGGRLAFSSRQDGIEQIMVLTLGEARSAPESIGVGTVPTWSPDGRSIAALVHGPGGAYLVTYPVAEGGALPLGIDPAGEILALTWTATGLPGEAIARAPTPPVHTPAATIAGPTGTERLHLVTLADLPAPQNRVSDAVDEAFQAVRDRAAAEAGWDFLGGLEHAFVGLNDPLPPGYAYNDWLYTGRAFEFHRAALEAGWVELVREDIGGRTYWRVYLRVTPQDGSLGEPLRERPWTFEERLAGDPAAYDQGGSWRDQIPSGYYVDFTRLAADFGFERLPALPGWRTFYPGARFNEFVRTDGLDWTAAMLEIYPASAIVTPTPYRTPTPTLTSTPRPTATRWWLRWRTPTATPTAIPSPSATLTPTP